MPESLTILILAFLGAVLYGAVRDQVTARICLEYFTVMHPPLVESQSPTVVALAWGVVATWWMGLLLGLPLARRVVRAQRELLWRQRRGRVALDLGARNSVHPVPQGTEGARSGRRRLTSSPVLSSSALS